MSQEKIKELQKDLAAHLLSTRASEIDERKLDFMRRHGMARDWRALDKSNPKVAEYLDKLKGIGFEGVESDGYSENDLKRKVAWYAQNRASKVGYVWKWDKATKNRCKHLLYYFANDPQCDWDLDKGLCFYGATGAGKTELFKVFQNFIVHTLPDSVKRFALIPCRKVYADYARAQESGIEKYTVGNWCFDDLGSEEPIYKHYGNDVNVMEQVLFYRAEERANGYLNTLITTNLETPEILERYGDRVYDRLRNMVTFVNIKGESKRI